MTGCGSNLDHGVLVLSAVSTPSPVMNQDRPISGRYEGEMISPSPGSQGLDLRVDVDSRYPESPVTNRLSGDFYRMDEIRLPGQVTSWRIFLESWIVASPTVLRSATEVEIRGSVLFYVGNHAPTSIRVRIPRNVPSLSGPAEVTFAEDNGNTRVFNCPKRSDDFREVSLEVDVCKSVGSTPLFPRYQVLAHPVHPHGLADRLLTLPETLRDAGIHVAVRATHSEVDDSAAQFQSWSSAELHDAMEQHFSTFRQEWPAWQLWGLLAGAHDEADVAGVMFDRDEPGVDGGPGFSSSPHRQGFAVFRDHEWFEHLPLVGLDSVGTERLNPAQADAARRYLLTWVHEVGHAFNLRHPWERGHEDALSWMNSVDRFEHLVDTFWDKFPFGFVEDELVHIRHGNRPTVIMGGDPFGSADSALASGPPGQGETATLSLAQVEGIPPVELLVRSKGYFDFLEPVFVELRVRNTCEGLALPLDLRLDPAYGAVVLFIRRPNGRVFTYDPVQCFLAAPRSRTLRPRPATEADQGPDRYSQEIFVSYGKRGYYFDEPGEYLVRAIYRGGGDLFIPSNVHRLRVGRPFTRNEDRLAQDFFSNNVGLSLYLKDWRSPFLDAAEGTLYTALDMRKGSATAARVASILADAVSKPFYRVAAGKVKQAKRANPREAVKLATLAREFYEKPDERGAKKSPKLSKRLNLPYRQSACLCAMNLKALGKEEEAADVLQTLRDRLAQRDVPANVLEEVQEFWRRLLPESEVGSGSGTGPSGRGPRGRRPQRRG